MKLTNVLKIGVVPFCAAALLACNNGKGGGDTPTSNKVNVTFKNYDGKILQTETIDKGGSVTYHQTDIPSKPITGGELGNKFIGWDKSLDNITSDTVLTAQYKIIDSTYKDHDNDGIPEGVDTNDYDNNFTAGVKSMVYFDNQNIKIDFSRFLGDDDVYDNDIAKLGLFMSNPKVDFTDGLFSDKAFGGRENALYSRLGCDDWHHFDFKDEAANTYKYDPKDTTSGVYGHKLIFDSNGNPKDLIFIAFEGTNGKNRWFSNFDVGYDNPMYYGKVAREDETGTSVDHPEWTDKRYHKGFYVAAKRVLEDKVDGPEPQQGQPDERKDGPVKFKSYIKSHMTYGKPIVFVTGHSRGGAMANIIGCYLEKDFKDEKGDLICDKTFTYTFAAPAPYGDSTEVNTRTIFNIINKDDIVTMVPFSEWGFSRLGNDYLKKSVKEEFKNEYEQNRDKRTYDCITGADSIFHHLGCTDRSEIYDLSTELYGSNHALNTESFDSEEEANGYIKAYNEIYSEKLGNFFNFIKFKPYPNGTKFDVYAYSCLGTITALAQAAVTNDSKVLDNMNDIIPMIANTKFELFLLYLLPNILQGGTDTIALPHDYGSYQILLRHPGED